MDSTGFRDDECHLNGPDGTERSTTTDSQQHQPPTHSAQVAMYRLRLCIVDCRCSSRRPGTRQTLWPKLWAQLRVSRLSPESLMSFTARTRNYELFHCTSQGLMTYTLSQTSDWRPELSISLAIMPSLCFSCCWLPGQVAPPITVGILFNLGLIVVLFSEQHFPAKPISQYEYHCASLKLYSTDNAITYNNRLPSQYWCWLLSN